MYTNLLIIPKKILVQKKIFARISIMNTKSYGKVYQSIKTLYQLTNHIKKK